MTTTLSDSQPSTFAQAIAKAAEAADLPKAERLKIHRTNIQALGFHEGLEGAARYKAAHPEAALIRLRMNALAYVPKPSGYDAYLASLADGWLSSEAALSTTNAADVERLNLRFGTSYPPGKHFSEPLSKGRIKKISTIFSRHGAPLDLNRVKTMSGVRTAAKAAKAQSNAERPLGRGGVISGNTLVINGQPFTVTYNGSRECIRVMIGGERQRVYLDQIEWLADLLGDCRNTALYPPTCRIGEPAYPVPTSENATSQAPEISDLASAETPSLSARIQAIAAAYHRPVHEPWDGAGSDPLAMTDAELADFARQSAMAQHPHYAA